MTTNLADSTKLTNERLLEQIERLAKRGELQSVIGVVEDVTERKEADYELRKSQARLEHLLTSSPVVIYSARPEGDFGATFVSANVSEQTGYEARRFVADSAFWFEHIHPDDQPRIPSELAQVFASGQHRYEYRFLHRDGTYRWMHDEVKLFRDGHGNPLEMIGSWSDVTQRKRAEEQSATLLEENRQLMQKLFRMQETERKHLARELHDELGQWLSAVQAHAQTLLNAHQPSSAEVQAGARVIVECISEVQRGVHRLIKQLRPALLDELGLEDSLRELVSQWSAQHPEVACQLAVAGSFDDVDDTLVITVYWLIQEALTNVARHAGARHVEIALERVRHEETGADTLRLAIGDDGKGLPAESGGGLGLLSMRERVLVAGGTYELSSHPGRGVHIEAELPLVPRRHDQEQASDPLGDHYGTSS